MIATLGMDAARRFGGVQRLYGEHGLAQLRAAHVVVAGIGGVGSWAVEALARSGVGELTLIDLDHVAESNINRQVHALNSTLGAAKVEVMQQRVLDIAHDCRVNVVDDFLTLENLAQLVPASASALVDAIDQVRVKAALIAYARAVPGEGMKSGSSQNRGLPIVVCGAAGGRVDPLSLRRDDLAKTQGDALLASVRARLRRDHQFPKTIGERFGVTAIYSGERVGPGLSESGAQGSALACSGYGSIVTVTASMGLAAAQWAIDTILTRAG